MSVAPDIEAFHREQAQLALDRYSASISRDDASRIWLAAKNEWRSATLSTLVATSFLRDIAGAIEKSAGHIAVLRRLLSPPVSQDQFALLCPEYSKSNENNGGAVKAANAAAIGAVILAWRDRELSRWIDEGRDPTEAEVAATTEALAVLIAAQTAVTNKRTMLAAKQEAEILLLLKGKGWTQKSAPLITQSAQLSAHEFMHKTRFATKTGAQEVDIACGLGRSVILAMECKVTNDATNSVKRVNDVLKKARAWQIHWGNFVKTAALLQGVIAYKDVHRLLDEDVAVFWSHRLEDFSAWLEANAAN